MTHISQFVGLSLLASAVGLLAGCNVGPKYVRPNYIAPPTFRGADDAAVVSGAPKSLGDEQWATVYREPELQALIRKALANNYDVRIAAQRILEQQAQVRITRSQQFPTITAGGTGIGASLPSSLGTQIPSPLVDGSFNLSAAWTPDFWGLYRKQTEAARAQLLAQTWAQRAVRLTLVQQVATAYLQIRALDSQLEITKETLKVRQDSVDLTKTLESGGSVPRPQRYRNSSNRFNRRRMQSPCCLERILVRSHTAIRMHSHLHRRIFQQDCPRSCLSVGPISSRQKPRSSPPMRRLVWRVRNSFPTCR